MVLRGYKIASFQLTDVEKAYISQTGGAWFNGSVGIEQLTW